MINDLKKHKGDNLGGINSWEFTPADLVAEIPPVKNGRVHYKVVLKAGTRWYEGYGTEGTMAFKDEQQDSENGSFHLKSFACKVPKMRGDLVDTLDQLKNRPLILVLIYNNGTKLLVGTPQEPVYISSSHDSKSDIPERNEFDLVISGEGVSKSPVYLA